MYSACKIQLQMVFVQIREFDFFTNRRDIIHFEQFCFHLLAIETAEQSNLYCTEHDSMVCSPVCPTATKKKNERKRRTR